MKNLILCFILLIAAGLKAQSFSAEIGQGFKFKDYHHPQFYSIQTTVKPTFTLTDNLRMDALMMGAFSDGYTYLFAGAGINYKVYEKEKFNLNIGLTSMKGSENRFLYGLNVCAGFKQDFYLTLNARHEYTMKEFWFDAGVGYNIIK